MSDSAISLMCFWSGVGLLIASFCAVTRNVLLWKKSGHYPDAPWYVRAALFNMAGTFGVVGVGMICSAPQAASMREPWPMRDFAWCIEAITVYKVSLTANLLRQYLPIPTRQRLNDLMRRICPRAA